VLVGSADLGQALEPLANLREALQLARRHTEPLARVVAEPREAEDLLAPCAEKGAGEAAKDRPAKPVLSRQASQPAVDYESGVMTVEAPAGGVGRYEDLGWNDLRQHGANIRRTPVLCQVL